MSFANEQNTSEDHDEDPLHNDENTKKKKVKNHGADNVDDIDTSNFSIEERLVSAVWVHERKEDGTSINDIKMKFRRRFHKQPPTKNTLYFWEKKIFSSGKVVDSKRSGRPCRRKAHMATVEASLQESPELSLRARAEKLSLPRTTLKKIIRDDLNITMHPPPPVTAKPRQEKKLIPGRRKKKQAAKPHIDPPAPPPVQQHNDSDAQCHPYGYPEPIAPLAFPVLQHYLTCPNNSYHQLPANAPSHSKDMDPLNLNPGVAHIVQHSHQHHSHPNNHGNYVTNGQATIMVKREIGYQQTMEHLQNGTRNQMSQEFHS